MIKKICSIIIILLFTTSVQAASKLDTIKKNGELVEASWPEALDLVASKLSQFKGNSYSLISSDRGTNEDHFIAQKFTRQIMQSNNIDFSSNTNSEIFDNLS